MKLCTLVICSLLLTVSIGNAHSAASKGWWHRLLPKILNDHLSFFGKWLKINVRKLTNPGDVCRGLDCPKYIVFNKTSDYELRCYPNYYWVGTFHIGEKLPRKQMFMRLVSYLKGENTRETKMNMTVPVLVITEPTEEESIKNYTMLFFIPKTNQSSLTRPTNSLVSLVHMPTFCVYVRTYKTYLWEIFSLISSKDWENFYLGKLNKSLGRDGVTDFADPERYMHFHAVYDGRWSLFGRRQEVWVVQT